MTYGSVALQGLCLVIALCAPASRAQPVGAALPPPADVLSLATSASTEVAMDTLTVTLYVVREGRDAAAVQSQLRQALDAALTEARKATRPKALEVQTGAFSLYPREATPAGRAAAPTIAGWTGRAELMLEGRDLTAVAQLVGRLTGMSVGRVAFGLSREAREVVEQDLAREAITRFRSQADNYARQFGYGGYRIREVQVGLQDPPVMMARTATVRTMGIAAVEEALPVEAGRTTVTTTVTGSVQMLR